MKSKALGLLVSLLVLGTFTTAPGECKAKAQAAAAAKTFPKVMTGFQTNMSVQILRCVRAHVPGFGTNQVVVLQYRLRKEGGNPPGSPPYDKDKFWTRDIKARDPVLGQSFKVWEATEGNETASGNFWTSEWKAGQNGDGYVWLNIPDRVKVVDIFFPYTNPQRVEIEVPKA